MSYSDRKDRAAAIALVVLAHVGALLWMQAARTVRVVHPSEQWIDLVPVASAPARPAPGRAPAAPGDRAAARATVQPPRTPHAPRAQERAQRTDAERIAAEQAEAERAAAVANWRPAAPAVDASAAPAPASPPLPSAGSAPADGHTLTARAVAAAGAADRAERGGKSAPLSAANSPRQKLAAAIDAATAGPRSILQAPRITELKDSTGYGRRIYKVETGLSTYCIVSDTNHALDGRDVIRDGTKQRTVSCPVEF